MNTSESPASPSTPFEWIGGEARVRALVDRFYDLMDIEPGYHYEDRFGHPRLRQRHMPFAIGVQERDQWLACMDQAMGETGVPEDLRVRLRESFFKTADWMRNRAGGV